MAILMMNTFNHKWFVITVLLIVFCSDIYADVPGLNNTGVLNDIVVRYKNAASGLGTKLIAYGSWLFLGLALISLTWTYGLLVLRRAEIGDFFLETIRFTVPLGFFFWVLTNGTAIAGSILQTLPMIASDASGLAYDLSPSGVVDVGFYVISKVFANSTIFQPIDTLISFVLGLMILLLLVLVAKNLLVLLVSGWLLIYGGVFLLGFGGGSWVTDIAISYIRTVLSIGMQTFGMVLVIGVGRGFIDQYLVGMQSANGVPYSDMLSILVSSIILYGLADAVPRMLGNIVGQTGVFGNGGLGLAGGSGSLGSLMSAAGTAVATLSVAANSLASAASSLKGNSASGSIASMAGFQDGGNTGSSSTNAAHDAIASSTESLARSMDPPNPFASNSNSSNGGSDWGGVGDSMSSNAENTYSNAADNSTNAQSSSSDAGQSGSSSENSLSAGDKGKDTRVGFEEFGHDEAIMAFINKDQGK